MKVGLVASSYLPNRGGLERHVDQLARGLARRGAEVELLTQGAQRGSERLAGAEEVIVRKFTTKVGHVRFAVAPSLWRRLRLCAEEFDVVDVHTSHLPLALAVARANPRRLVLTLHAPLPRLMAWPYSHAVGALIEAADRIICTSGAEREILCRSFPAAARSTEAVTVAVDAAEIRAAVPYLLPGKTLLLVGRLDRNRCAERAIAALPSLDPSYRLTIVGSGPARRRLQAYAEDLRVAMRVRFAGSAGDVALNRWLRTADVVLALAREDSSGLQVLEGLAAGATVVASEIPVHREVAVGADLGRVVFVSTEGSPLEVADAITEAIGRAPADPRTADGIASWDVLVDRTWDRYRRLVYRDDAARPVKLSAEPRDADMGSPTTIVRHARR